MKNKKKNKEIIVNSDMLTSDIDFSCDEDKKGVHIDLELLGMKQLKQQPEEEPIGRSIEFKKDKKPIVITQEDIV